MKIKYDPEVDALYIEVNPQKSYKESEEISENIIVDYGPKGEIIGLEILNAKNTIKEIKNLKELLLQYS